MRGEPTSLGLLDLLVHLLRALFMQFLVFTTVTILPGCAIVTPQDAYLFTDGRYFLQASKQLDQYVPCCMLCDINSMILCISVGTGPL